MGHKDGAPILAEKNRAAPSVRDRDFTKRRMKVMNPPLDGLELILGLSFGNIDVFQIAGVVRVHEPGAADHASVPAAAAPQIWQINRVEGVPTGKADSFEPLFIH